MYTGTGKNSTNSLMLMTHYDSYTYSQAM